MTSYASQWRVNAVLGRQVYLQTHVCLRFQLRGLAKNIAISRVRNIKNSTCALSSARYHYLSTRIYEPISLYIILRMQRACLVGSFSEKLVTTLSVPQTSEWTLWRHGGTEIHCLCATQLTSYRYIAYIYLKRRFTKMYPYPQRMTHRYRIYIMCLTLLIICYCRHYTVGFIYRQSPNIYAYHYYRYVC